MPQRTILCRILLALGLTMPTTVWAAEVMVDDFEDGAINPENWVVGGRPLSWTFEDRGSWTWSEEEIVDPNDGYLRLRVNGPYTDDSYGAASYLRTTRNFNDGKPHTINFTMGVNVSDDHENRPYIQVTDGWIPPFEERNWQNGWLYDEPFGTTNLWSSQEDPSRPKDRWQIWNLPVDVPKQDWSITLDPSTYKARLYAGHDGKGALLLDRWIDPNNPWFVRFMIEDATSEGFPASEMSLNLYDFSATDTLLVQGDLDRDADVDIFDVAVLQTKYGMTSGATWADGDFDANGTVDIFDAALMQVNYGYGVANSPAAVPEPSTLVLAGLGSLGLVGCALRRRKRTA
ncbi:MAG: PEP-CTERM sorting domain-containing protein [Pirellulales bacterium]